MKWNDKINLDEHDVWFTSDLHLFHENIIKMNNRPFEDVYKMWDYLKEEINSKVKDNDYLFILGDVLWGSQETKINSFLKAIKGKKILVIGNHDKQKNVAEETPEGRNFSQFYSVARADYIKFISKKKDFDQDIYMCHYPALTWPGKSRGSWHLHGHTHGNIDEYNESQPDLRVDVGIDSKLANMKLLSFWDIQEYFYNKAGTHNFHNYMQQIYAENKTIK